MKGGKRRVIKGVTYFTDFLETKLCHNGVTRTMQNSTRQKLSLQTITVAGNFETVNFLLGDRGTIARYKLNYYLRSTHPQRENKSLQLLYAFSTETPQNTHYETCFTDKTSILPRGVHGLKDISIDIPLAVAAGTTVNMSCGYDLESDTLYVMKWYYKGSEFFRFVPKEMPPTSTFGELGNKVILNKSDAHRVVLRDLQPNYTGKYLCEVSGDSPSFTTLVDVGYMHVANLPKGDPQVRFEKIRYAVGDTVRGNCTVPSGNPPANVTWTVNGVPVNSSFIMNVTDKLGDNQQLMSIAGLDFEIIPDSFSNGRLHIVCNANVFHLYKKQADVRLMEERPRLASVLGTRESSYIGGAAIQIKEWFLDAAITLLLCSFR
ncbi:hypothetical protein K0M31_007385 [Melipona bicolor]|uniref:Ig-like domain-containing protein n=1 Tax=Melipona bicolor TaxID=60889 RepID=A0AA40GBB3_9HYME|nr:hypothetical protein K0M31_007385 [Melipona bicolor]